MAHNLWIEEEMTHMMYVGETPWHGLGTQLERPATSAEAIQAAGLDWKVRMVPLVAQENGCSATVRGRCGIVPEDRWGKPDCPVFGIVTPEYEVLQNVEAFEFFDSIVGEGAAVYHTAGALGQGEKVWILAKLDGRIEVTAGDAIDKYVLLFTGHDGRTGVCMYLTPVRVVCQNTFTIAIQTGKRVARAYHTRDLWHGLATARQQMQFLIQSYQRIGNICRAMVKKQVNDQTVRSYLKLVFPDPSGLGDKELPVWIQRDRASCFHLFHYGKGTNDAAIRGTVWAAYNGVTEYVDHWRPENRGEHMQTVCFGVGARIKKRAFRIAQQLAA